MARQKLPWNKLLSFDNIYPTLVNLRWYKLILICLLLLLSIHSVFAGLYYAGGPGSVHDTENRHSYLDCFFFSVQTMSTIGYGDLKPKSLYVNFLVLVQSWCGLILDCILIGIFYCKFSRPSRLRNRLLFSPVAVINRLGQQQDADPNDMYRYLVFRIVNAHKPQFVDAKLKLLLLQWEPDQPKTLEEPYQGFDNSSPRAYNASIDDVAQHTRLISQKKYVIPRITELYFHVNAQAGRTNDLDYSTFALPVPWTVTHKLDEDSPLTSLLLGNRREEHFEIVALYSGVEESISDSVQARFSYIPSDIKHDYRFEACVKMTKDGYIVDVSKFSTLVPIK